MSYRYESATIARAAVALGVIGGACVTAMTFLAWDRVPIPDALASIGGGAVGALATLLTTFTPSPVPGGRRQTDSVVAARPDDVDPSTLAAGSPTVGPVTLASGKGGLNG